MDWFLYNGLRHERVKTLWKELTSDKEILQTVLDLKL